MTTITKERIELFVKSPLENGLTRGEQMELARIALASLEAKPVAWECGENIILFNPDTVEAYAKRVEISPKPLYAAPPAPVVPDGYALVPVEPTDEMIAAAMNCEDVLFNSDESFCVQFGNIYEAMLAAAPKPQNAPQNIPAGKSTVTPDGWISCSERMPDNDESKPIAIFTGKCLGQGMFVATYDDDGFFDYWEGMEIIGVTHWMPLPAPPQQ
ncbi:DUF551 domain-containing protein [Salmonella enterica]|nr:DUF551 domain-containing protein [Salmonella enterica]ECF7240153.1 DUF551 domain-containing protein [Salmonella enterica subsp. enterica]EDR7389503.1 DUF551 domain-containing protein [Salmonella enterica subsp. enterica serovar Oranienburg]EAN4312473.1 DUF551 domain-containing protein [Salmonella enterica]EAO7008380.1 DUF551 domain-containing protein [Salmonella enterica]